MNYRNNSSRDLAKNWNIDIANDLEDYLSDLESISVSFDGGRTSLNFAEAALLIQGTACVYSRKVEYLHELVLNTLNLLSERQSGAIDMNIGGLSTDDNGGNATGGAHDNDGDDFQDDAEGMLILDDDIKIAKNITLVENDAPPSRSLKMLPSALMGSLSSESRNTFRVNACLVHEVG